jgi:hypothetical protein
VKTMAKYRVFFDCGINIEAENASEAIKKAWLTENLQYATFKYKDVKKLDDVKPES